MYLSPQNPQYSGCLLSHFHTELLLAFLFLLAVLFLGNGGNGRWRCWKSSAALLTDSRKGCKHCPIIISKITVGRYFPQPQCTSGFKHIGVRKRPVVLCVLQRLILEKDDYRGSLKEADPVLTGRKVQYEIKCNDENVVIHGRNITVKKPHSTVTLKFNPKSHLRLHRQLRFLP